MMRETPINRSVSPIMSCVFPSLFPQTEALLPQDGTPCCGAPVMLYLTDLDFTSEDGTLCPQQVCEINWTARPGYGGTLLEHQGFILSKTPK